MKKRTFGRSRPSIAYELAFRKELLKLGKEMQEEVEREIMTFAEKEMAQDALPISVAQIMKAMREKWYRRYLSRGRQLAKWLASKTDKRTQAQIMNKLKAIGFSITPTFSDEKQAAIDAIVEANVNLIRAIPQQYLKRVQTAVTVAFKKGQDRYSLAQFFKKTLRQIGDTTANHAALLSRDQTQKATQALAIANATACGARRGRWLHVPGKFSARITHKHMDGKVFDLDKGLYDEAEGKWVKPGELIYCNCQFEVIMPGFEESEEP